jgi:hypothetical protein
MSDITLRGCLCDIIVLNVHAPTKDKSDDTKDSFYTELDGALDQFPKYHLEILLGEKTFPNQWYGMRVYMKLVMIMGLK